MRFAGTAAVTCVPLTKVVAKVVLLNDTVTPLRKPVPTTFKVKAGPPAVVVDGEMLLITGAGTVIVRLTALDEAVPVLVAVIGTVPGFATRLAGTVAVS